METKKKLEEITDKLEGTIWQDFQYYSVASDALNEFDDSSTASKIFLYKNITLIFFFIE